MPFSRMRAPFLPLVPWNHLAIAQYAQKAFLLSDGVELSNAEARGEGINPLVGLLIIDSHFEVL